MLDAIEAPRVSDPFASAGYHDRPLLSQADQKTLLTMLASMWMAGQSARSTSFIITVPRAFSDRIIDLIERAPLDDIDGVGPQGLDDEAAELDILWKALRGKEREQGMGRFVQYEARRRAKEADAAKLKHQPE